LRKGAWGKMVQRRRNVCDSPCETDNHMPSISFGGVIKEEGAVVVTSRIGGDDNMLLLL
jgi:hypothetical protein